MQFVLNAFYFIKNKIPKENISLTVEASLVPAINYAGKLHIPISSRKRNSPTSDLR
jgi:hypothetical protein